ncbi:Pal1 cell morphology protein-domain-containing protein [Kalaharituber pfeilii]|nr:Pal1 cell morphology protein-domain-containing protein [Kalaharituber pfeilii]
MSLVQPPLCQPSPQFGSNNPFRNRASQVPPFPSTPLSPDSGRPASAAPPQRPQSRNPFLDVFGDDDDLLDIPPRPLHKSNSFNASSAPRPQLTGAAAELFENLTITDHDRELKAQMNQGSQSVNRDALKPQIPPGQLPSFKGRPPPPLPAGHRYSKSSDGRPPAPISGAPFSADNSKTLTPSNRFPPNREVVRPRQRRNSDSSVMDTHEIERERAKERERRERKLKEARRAAESGGSKDSDGHRPSKSSSSRSKKGAPLDIIDKLDVTGVYGSGLFHHDGPFDACNPHRNKNSRRAPMEAFPADSANNALTGFGPVSEKGDLANYYGNRDPEAYLDFNMSAGRRGSSDDILKRPGASRATSFDPVARVEPVHGDETLGLGSSTFLDGAPASKKAILQQINEAQQAEQQADKSGLGRKKSLSHKIRGLSGSRPRFNPDVNRRRGSDEGMPSPGDRFSPSTPGSTMQRKKNENNPFLSDYDAAYDKKSEAINTDYDRKRDRAPSSPKRPPMPASSVQSSDAGSGLLKRVRSLSKSKRKE